MQPQIPNEKPLTFVERSARLTESVIEQTYSAVMITSRDGADPKISYVNPAFVKLIGCPAGKLIGNPISDLESFIGPWHLLRRVLSTGVPFTGETQIHRVDGQELIVDCTISAVKAQPSEVTHWAVILHDITERKQMEREILQISDREQSRIARDLHDGLGQQLTALELFSVGLVDELKTEAPALVPPLKKIGEQLRDAVRQTRALASGLMPVLLETDGLTSALHKLANSTSTMAKLECEFVCDSLVEIQDGGVATHLYRIAQEAITNALKHGRPKNVRILLGTTAGQLRLKISDDGQGFSPCAGKEGGLGLRAMKYRADLIDAILSIDSEPGKGTQVTCTLRQLP